MTDIVKRLRDQGKDAFAKHYSLGMFQLCSDAVDEIERLRATCGQSMEEAASDNFGLTLDDL